jgi:hypothetical protein
LTRDNVKGRRGAETGPTRIRLRQSAPDEAGEEPVDQDIDQRNRRSLDRLRAAANALSDGELLGIIDPPWTPAALADDPKGSTE